jgi:hypothetical protein
MRRTLGTAAFILPVVALTLSPWMALAAPRAPLPDRAAYLGMPYARVVTEPAPAAPAEARSRGSTECNCRTVDVKLNNFVRDAEVKTGDAKVVNFNVTYVSNAYGDTDVDVDQEAEAVSGDAIAGQLIAVDARGPGCVNLRVNATNHVEDTKVESGDATAINRSVVLLDPGVRRGDLEIDVEQDAEAQSGDAIAGQVIGLVGGSRVGRCGGAVDLTAFNEVFRTKVETGKALTQNESDIRTCAVAGCAAELRRLLGAGAELEVCSGRRCREVDAEELGATLQTAALRPDPEGETHDDLDPEMDCDADAPEPGPHQQSAGASPAPTPAAKESPAPAASAQPSPSPAPTAPACPTPTPSADDPDAPLMASGADDVPDTN